MIGEDTETNPEDEDNGSTNWKFIYEIIYELAKELREPGMAHENSQESLATLNRKNSTQLLFDD